MKGVDQVVCLCGRNEELRDQLAPRLRRRQRACASRLHRRDARLARRGRRARALDRRPHGARGADARLPGDLLRLGPRPRPRSTTTRSSASGSPRSPRPRLRSATPSRPRSSRAAPRSTSRICRPRPRSSSPRSNRECPRRCMRPERAVATLGLGALARLVRSCRCARSPRRSRRCVRHPAAAARPRHRDHVRRRAASGGHARRARPARPRGRPRDLLPRRRAGRARYPALAAEIAAAGHEIGIHGHRHTLLLRRSPARAAGRSRPRRRP